MTLSQAARKSCGFSARCSLFIVFKCEIPQQRFTDNRLRAHNTVFVLHRCLFSRLIKTAKYATAHSAAETGSKHSS